MATITNLLSSGEIDEFEPGDSRGRLKLRNLYVSKPFMAWALLELPSLVTAIGSASTPNEQFYALAFRFWCGDSLNHTRQFHSLRPSDRSVWQLKTDDVRVFGFFPERDKFVAVFGGYADLIKERDLYHGYVEQVVRMRDLVWQVSQFIKSSEPEDVISNANRSA